ncbi:MAG TPA: hypothetical protein VGH38_18830 [Bryobacteraceae bacterium]|jgi:hypothetical protein
MRTRITEERQPDARKPKATRPASRKAYIETLLQAVSKKNDKALETLTAEIVAQDPPASPEERIQIDILAHATWQNHCLAICEGLVWAEAVSKATAAKSPVGAALLKRTPDFTRIQRLMDATDRTFYRSLDELQRLRGLRKAAAPKPEAEPEPISLIDFPGAGWIM